MQAATAAADFTPKPGLVTQGHAGTPPTTQVLHPLQVRSIVFEHHGAKAAIATIDVVGLESEQVDSIRRRIEQKCGIPADHIMIACSHTHCAPATLGVLGMKPDKAYMKSVEDALINSVADAAGRLEPVTLGLGCGSAYFNINRRPLVQIDSISATMTLNYGGIVDRRARILRVDKRDGKPLAVLFHYSCHPTTRSSRQGDLSSDYPGVARKLIEKQLNCHALYIPGCFGNIRPAILNQKTGGFDDATVEQLAACGNELGEAVVKAARYVRTFDADQLDVRNVQIRMPFEPLKSVEELTEMTKADKSHRPNELLAPWAARVLDRIKRNDIPKDEPSPMQLMRIGPLLCITIGAECVQEIGQAVERRVSPMTDADAVWAIGYTNDMLGYITTQRQKSEGGYEPNAYPYFDRIARFNEEEQTIVDGAVKLMQVK